MNNESKNTPTNEITVRCFCGPLGHDVDIVREPDGVVWAYPRNDPAEGWELESRDLSAVQCSDSDRRRVLAFIKGAKP